MSNYFYLQVKTSTIKGTSFPVFNEQLTIIDLFPPLCQRIKIEVCYGDQLKKTVQSFRYINLRSISNDKEEGFLPTLGPIFLHLYTNNHLEGYAGTIIMAMNTELEDLMMLDTRKPNLAKPIPHLDEVLPTTSYYFKSFIFKILKNQPTQIELGYRLDISF